MLGKLKEALGFGQKQDPHIVAAEAINGLNESSAELRSKSKAYKWLCVEAIEKGNEDYADELIEVMANMTDFASELDFFATQIKAEIIMLMSFDNLNKLAGALDNCVKLINSRGDFSAVKASISAFKTNLGQGRAAISDIRKELKGKVKPNDYFNDVRVTGEEEVAKCAYVSSIFADIVAELVIRNAGKDAITAADTKSSTAGKYAGAAADIDLTRKIAEEETEQE